MFFVSKIGPRARYFSAKWIAGSNDVTSAVRTAAV